MRKTQSFGIDWLQDVLEIRPIFSCKEIFWSAKLNKVLAEEAELEQNDWALLVLDSLTDHFTGNWGNVSLEQKHMNDSSLKYYLSGGMPPGRLISKYNAEGRTVIIVTNDDYTETVVMIEDEL